MWIDDIANYTKTLAIPGLKTDHIFVHTIPFQLDVAMMFAAGYQGMPVDPELPGYHKGQIQMIVRAKKSLDAETIATLAADLLTLEGVEIGELSVNYIRPRHLPAVFPVSNGDHHEASVNFDICFVRQIG